MIERVKGLAIDPRLSQPAARRCEGARAGGLRFFAARARRGAAGREAEINPLIVKAQGVVAVDARLVLKASLLLAALREILAAAEDAAGLPDITALSRRAQALPARVRSARRACGARPRGRTIRRAAGACRSQRVAVDLRAAAASLRSARYLRINGGRRRRMGSAVRLLSGARRLDQHPLQLRRIIGDAALKVLQSPSRDRQEAEKKSAAPGTAKRSRTRSMPPRAAPASCAARPIGGRHAQAKAVAARAAHRDRADRRRAARKSLERRKTS